MCTKKSYRNSDIQTFKFIYFSLMLSINNLILAEDYAFNGLKVVFSMEKQIQRTVSQKILRQVQSYYACQMRKYFLNGFIIKFISN